MFSMSANIFHQVAYVTSSLDAAMALFERDYGVPSFYSFTNTASGAAIAGGAQLRIALANVGGMEIELIEPLGDTAPLYSEVLPGGPGLALRFHHVAIRVEGPVAKWESHFGAIDTARHPIVAEGSMGDDMRYIYTDERSTLGHYVEHVWMSPGLLAQLSTVIPHYPARS